MPPESTSESESSNVIQAPPAAMPGAAPLDTPAEPLGSLAEVIQESQAAMNEAPLAPVKNKGGRPKGSKTKNRTAALDTPPPAPEPIGPPPPDLAPMLGMVAGLPFAIAATRTKFEGFRLTGEESGEIGKSLDLVVQKYFPNLSEKAGVGVMACFTIAVVALSKVQAYEMWKAEIIAHAARMNAENNATTELKSPEVPVTDLTGNPFVSRKPS